MVQTCDEKGLIIAEIEIAEFIQHTLSPLTLGSEATGGDGQLQNRRKFWSELGGTRCVWD